MRHTVWLWLLCAALWGLPARAALLWEVPAEQAWPDLLGESWRPDLLVRNDLPTMDRAAAVLGAAATAETEPFWVRLDAFDLCQVGDCETCQPPPADPYAVRSAEPLSELTADHLRFVALAHAALADTPARPYVVVPPDGLPTPLLHVPGLVVLLEPPARPALADRAGQAAAWAATGATVYHLVRDGWAEAPGLPLGADALRAAAAGLGAPALLVARDERHATAPTPAWLAGALARTPEPTALGDAWRADSPLLARVADLLVPLGPTLAASDEPEAELAALTLAALEGTLAPTADLPATLAAQAAAGEALGLPRPATGPLSAAWQAHVARGAAPSTLTLPLLTGVSADGNRQPAEWAAATRVELTGDDAGVVTPRPATVWLRRDDEALLVAVEATEPNPADASPRDRLRLWLAGPAGERVWVGVEVAGRSEAWALPEGSTEPRQIRLSGVESAGVFDGPGWSLELRLPWRALGFDGPAVALNLATETRRGTEVAATYWQPSFGASWLPARWGRVLLH